MSNSNYIHNPSPIHFYDEGNNVVHYEEEMDEMLTSIKYDFKYSSWNQFPMFFVRHAQSEGNLNKEAYRDKLDYSIILTELGHKQAKVTGNAISSILTPFCEHIESIEWSARMNKKLKLLIFCSPFIRARQTLDIILSQVKGNYYSSMIEFDIRENPLLVEQSVGLFSGLREEEFNGYHELYGPHYAKHLVSGRYQNEHRFWAPLPLGESLFQTYQRSEIFYTRNLLLKKQEIMDNYDGVFFVGHGAQLKTLIAAMLNDYSFVASYGDTFMKNAECLMLNGKSMINEEKYDVIANFYPHAI
jgi:broad specificity phosphatase PhoE